MKEYPIPVHIECKGTRGKIRPHQIIQKNRIEKSGSIFLLISRPSDFYDFLISSGIKHIKITFSIKERLYVHYTEKEVVAFVRDSLKYLEKLFGVYWERNQQNIGSNKGRPDFYAELPVRRANEKKRINEHR